MEHPYRINERADGFDILGTDRNPVHVDLTPFAWRLRFAWQDGQQIDQQVDLYAYSTLMKYVAEGLMAFWQPPAREKDFPGLRKWALEQTRKGLGKRVHTQWKRLLATVDTSVLAVHRNMFRATFRGITPLIHSPALYQHPYLVKDLGEFRAAAVAAQFVHWLHWAGIVRKRINSPEWFALREQQRDGRLDNWLHYGRMSKHIEDESQVLEALMNWRGLFSPTGEGYTSLNRTLNQLPHGISSGLLCYLSQWRLERPITDRLELTLVLCYASRYAKDAGGVFMVKSWRGQGLCYEPLEENPLHQRPGVVHIIQHAPSVEIKKALSLLGEAGLDGLSPRRSSSVDTLVSYLADYPEDHYGSLVGLTKRAIEWHEHERQARQRDFIPPLDAGILMQGKTLDRNTPTAMPPIPLLAEAGLRFLATVGEIYDEAAVMGHCIGTYAQKAVSGGCYLFHLDDAGEQASAEVDRFGRVLQSFGPKNRKNSASQRAEKILSSWGEQFPQWGGYSRDASAEWMDEHPVIPF